MSVLADPQYSYLVNKQPLFFQFWKKIFYYWCKFVFLWYTPVRVLGRENLPNESAIFTSNHNSHMDVALISAAAGKSFNYFGMLAAKDYWFDSTIKRTLTNFVMNLVPIARKTEERNGDTFTFDDTIELCRAFMDQDGRNLVIFPEGSRGEPNMMRPFRKGAARFSVHLNAPIVPIFIDGSFRSWPKGRFIMYPARVNVKILPPIHPSDFVTEEDSDHYEQINQMTKTLEGQIQQVRKSFYAG